MSKEKTNKERLQEWLSAPLQDDPERDIYFDYWDTREKLEDELNTLSAAQKNGPQYNTEEHLRRMRELRTELEALEVSTQRAISKLKINPKPVFSEDIVKAYTDRLNNWPEEVFRPTYQEDEDWLRETFGMSRGPARKFMAKYRPPDWTRGRPKRT